MMSAALERYKWPKLHEHVVEECRTLDVHDVLTLDAYDRATLRTWSPPTHPWLLLVSRWGGPFRRWWFECPSCGRRCETLYQPPGPLHEDWACRMCWDLIYASQRYGRRHPARQVLTRRKCVTRAKRDQQLVSAERRRARELAKARRASSGGQVSERPAASLASEFAPVPPSDMAQVRAATEEGLRALVPLALATLQEISSAARSKRLRQQARGSLERYARSQGAQQSQPATPVPTGPTSRPPAPQFTREEVASIERVFAENIALYWKGWTVSDFERYVNFCVSGSNASYPHPPHRQLGRRIHALWMWLWKGCDGQVCSPHLIGSAPCPSIGRVGLCPILSVM